MAAEVTIISNVLRHRQCRLEVTSFTKYEVSYEIKSVCKPLEQNMYVEKHK